MNGEKLHDRKIVTLDLALELINTKLPQLVHHAQELLAVVVFSLHGDVGGEAALQIDVLLLAVVRGEDEGVVNPFLKLVGYGVPAGGAMAVNGAR